MAQDFISDLGTQPGETRDFRLFLQTEFMNRCRRNPRYTMSSFARALGMDVSTLAKILKGQRPIRQQGIRKLGTKLGLDPQRIAEFEVASPRANAKSKKITQAPSGYQQLTLDAFEVISDWSHYAILELMALPQFKSEPTWIAKALGISSIEVSICIERLLRLEMIERRTDGSLKDISTGFTTTLGNSFSAAGFRKLQKQILEKAILALEDVPFEKRSQTAVTMAVDSRKLPEAKKMIVDFQRKLNRFLTAGKDTRLDDVYQLSVSLFPTTQLTKNTHSGGPHET